MRLQSVMDEETKRFVRERADNRCEYCRVQQQFYPESAARLKLPETTFAP